MAMTQRKLQTALTWLCLLLHLFAGTGMAQEAVICIAQDGHFAIETPHANTGCVAAQQTHRPIPSGPALENSAPQTCQDTPIFAAGSSMTVPRSVETVPPVSQFVSLLCPPTVVTQDACPLLSHVTSNARRSTLHVLRSVVLLI